MIDNLALLFLLKKNQSGAIPLYNEVKKMPDEYKKCTRSKGEVPLGVREFFELNGDYIGKGELVQSGTRYHAFLENGVHSARVSKFPEGMKWVVYRD